MPSFSSLVKFAANSSLIFYSPEDSEITPEAEATEVVGRLADWKANFRYPLKRMKVHFFESVVGSHE